MKFTHLVLLGLLLTVLGCNDSNNQPQKQTERTNEFLTLSDLLSLIDKDDLKQPAISNYLTNINSNWQYKGADENEMFFFKTNDEKTKEMLTYKYKQFIIEYLTFSKNHYMDICKEITENNFKVVTEAKNDLGGQEYQYTSDKYNIITKEIPLTEPGKSGFKVFVAQKH